MCKFEESRLILKLEFSCRRSKVVNSVISIGVMEDAIGKKNKSLGDLIQETGQEQRPARMVGLSSLDSAKISMEAVWGSRVRFRRQGEEK
jgi:hypothetical protein